jgi:uncharacterized membrane protein
LRRGHLLVWLIVAIVLRFLFLGGDALWLDEGYTAWIAHLGATERAKALASDDAPPLYYAIQHVLVPHLPPSESSVRLVSAVAGVAGVACAALCPPAAVVSESAVAFLSVGGYGVFYGRQARSYSLLILWELVLITSLARTLRGERRWLFGVVAAEILALWTHNVAITLVAGANLAWLLLSRKQIGRWVASQALVAIAWLPVLLRALHQFSAHASMNRWIEEFWRRFPLALAPVFSLQAMTGGARTWPELPGGIRTYHGPGSTVIAVLSFLAVAILLIAAFRKQTRSAALLAASLSLGPLLALTFLSAVTSPTYIAGRTDAVAYAGFVFWIAAGFTALPRAGRYATGGILALMTLLSIGASMPTPSRALASDRAVGSAVRTHSGAGDRICYVGLSRPSIDYYVSGGRPGREDGRTRFHYPAVFGTNPAGDRSTPAESLAVWESEAYRVRESFEASSGGAFVYVGPIQPTAPDPCTAEDLPYPGSILAYMMNGLRPITPIARVRGDRIAVDWIAFRLTREDLVPRSELKPIEERP